MEIKAVIWDVDGTLISTSRLYPEAYRRALAPYIGRDMTDNEILGVQRHSELGFLRAQAGRAYDACVRDFQMHYRDLHETHFDGAFPGILETLAALRKRGMKMGVVTGKSRNSCEVSLAIGALGSFDVLVADDDVGDPKPHPEGMLVALRALTIKPGEAIYIGDSVSDIEAAHAAGTAAAAALWSKDGSRRAEFIERVKEAGGAYLLDAPPDLLELL